MDGFAQVYQAYYDRVYRFLLSLTGDTHQAEELTQDVFYKVLLHIDRYRDQGSMLTWLCTIGKNAWLNECRRKKRLLPLEDREERGSGPGPEETLTEKERVNALRRAVMELPEDWRDVVILHAYGRVPLKEIAAQKGKSESWARTTYYRARQLLARKLEGF